MMSEECVDDNDEKKSMLKLKLKPKLAWFIIGIPFIYFMYNEVINDEDENNDD